MITVLSQNSSKVRIEKQDPLIMNCAVFANVPVRIKGNNLEYLMGKILS